MGTKPSKTQSTDLPSTNTLLTFDPDMEGGQPAKWVSLQSILNGDFLGEDELERPKDTLSA